MTVLNFVISNWQFFASLLALALTWFDAKAKFSEYLNKADTKHEDLKKWAKSKDLYKSAETAYNLVDKLARKTETTIDDKAAEGLKYVLKLMKGLGWDESEIGEGEQDVVRKVFDALHQVEKKENQL